MNLKKKLLDLNSDTRQIREEDKNGKREDRQEEERICWCKQVQGRHETYETAVDKNGNVKNLGKTSKRIREWVQIIV